MSFSLYAALGHKRALTWVAAAAAPLPMTSASQQTGFNPKCTVVVHVALRGTEKDMIY